MSQICTALDIRPAFEPKSYAEIVAEAAARKKRLFSPRSAPQKRDDEKSDVVVRTYNTAPVQRVWTCQQDSHVRAFYAWKGHQPMAYLKARCREIGVEFIAITGPCRYRWLVNPRHRLMAEVKHYFPKLSFPQLSAMFNRDHTTALFAVNKFTGFDFTSPFVVEVPGEYPDQNGRKGMKFSGDLLPEMERLFTAGLPSAEIARRLGIHGTTVRRTAIRRGWTR